MPILSVWPGKSFETLAIIVIFRKKKEEREKKEQKKISRVCFSLVYVQRRDFVSVLGSRL